jgi:hypothetical protein
MRMDIGIYLVIIMGMTIGFNAAIFIGLSLEDYIARLTGMTSGVLALT